MPWMFCIWQGVSSNLHAASQRDPPFCHCMRIALLLELQTVLLFFAAIISTVLAGIMRGVMRC